MIPLNYNVVSAIGEYDLIAQSKQVPSRTNLIALRGQVDTHYTEYLNTFNNLHNKAANPFNAANSTELRNCYNNPTAALENLKGRLVSSQSPTFKFLCPYCLIINHTTFDHYVPKEEQPVYSVCARNLIPSCNLCNGMKNQYWRDQGQRAIIHFYNDNIPNEQFLFCDLTFNADVPILNFRLTFPDNYDAALRSIIEKHFERLDLLNRYDETAPSVLSDIDVDFKSLVGFIPTPIEVRQFLSNKAIELSAICGVNFWRSVAYGELASSNNYINILTA